MPNHAVSTLHTNLHQMNKRQNVPQRQIFVPFAILLVETRRRRRTAIGVFQALGIAVGLYLLYFLVRFPVTAHVHGRSIVYDSPHFYIVGVLVNYLLATCVSGLFSSHRCINAFGVLAFVLAVAAYQGVVASGRWEMSCACRGVIEGRLSG